MRQKVLILALLTALLPGCQQTSAGDKVKRETQEMVKATSEYLHARYVTDMQAELEAINRTIDELAVRAGRAGEALKADAQTKLQELRARAGRVSKELEGVKSAAASNWSDTRAGFEQSWGSLKNDVQQAGQWMTEQVAP
jgi:ElaB/YqjD/DUF883 family membrane-anchored ribosome-binding protein